MRTRNADKEELVKTKAKELLVNEGFEGFSMNKLARACGISVATLYIYYQDKDHLIKQIGVEIGKRFFATALQGFDPNMPFAQGLRQQWENRISFHMQNKLEAACYEVIRHSPHGEYVLEESFGSFGSVMGQFCHNAIQRGELVPLTMEVFWSIAYGPLYNMLKFDTEGKSLGKKPFAFTNQMKDEALRVVIKALTP
ncbi:TetR family transcriptional regulator [Flavobacterium akiainvivens]|uniref:TetR family transcriptional regulator n=1 Tax=Flavobacterium akiainvivens TaxID=1202724 RepID=A0A0M8ME35_9FLAO|nr:TetR/AcrR family transcriptional regulator [Flavobacterium akiainvivens]KOS06944.1 TetR family transcriptional regulator [Flavobacterium akiainvivens]SFQ60229.1 transcriptional regulator, TetR family [Flavobacterium akiainvivens]